MNCIDRQRLNITAEEYHKRDEFSSSAIRKLNDPELFYELYIARTQKVEETDAMRFGSCFHLLFEKSSDWGDFIKVLPSVVEHHECIDEINAGLGKSATQLLCGDEINLRVTAHRQYIDAIKQDAISRGITFCTEDELTRMEGMLQAVLDDPYCHEILERGGNKEQAAIARHASTKLRLRALADIDQEAEKHIIDLKTTKERTEIGFSYDAKKRGYHRQLAWYEGVLGAETSGLIAVTNTAPYKARYFEFSEQVREQAREQNEWALSDLGSRMAGGDPNDRDNWRSEGYGCVSVIGESGLEADVEYDV